MNFCKTIEAINYKNVESVVIKNFYRVTYGDVIEEIPISLRLHGSNSTLKEVIFLHVKNDCDINKFFEKIITADENFVWELSGNYEHRITDKPNVNVVFTRIPTKTKISGKK